MPCRVNIRRTAILQPCTITRTLIPFHITPTVAAARLAVRQKLISHLLHSQRSSQEGQVTLFWGGVQILRRYLLPTLPGTPTTETEIQRFMRSGHPRHIPFLTMPTVESVHLPRRQSLTGRRSTCQIKYRQEAVIPSSDGGLQARQQWQLISRERHITQMQAEHFTQCGKRTLRLHRMSIQ